MDPTGIDPHVAPLMARLAEIVFTNTATAVTDQVRTIMTKKTDQEKITELNQLVRELVEEKSEVTGIAQAFKEQLVAQQISDDDIKYIIDTVIPVLEDMIDWATGTMSEAEAEKMRQGLDALKPILSVKTLTVLQLVGFNFKRAIGEPLTLLMQKLITARSAPDQQAILENNRLHMATNIELLKVSQDEEATVRLERLLRTWNTPAKG
jgi:hypothetical protein